MVLGGSVLRLSKSGEVASVVWLYHPPYTLCFSLTATPPLLLVAVAIGLEYNAAHSSVVVGCRGGDCRAVSCCSQSESECKRLSSTVCVESRIEQSSSVCCDSYNVESDNYAVDRRGSQFVIVRLEVVYG